MSDFNSKLEYARTYMLLWSPFFGALTMSLKIEERDYPHRTVWTNGKDVFFEKNYVSTITREEFTAVLMHEILHIALLHKKRLQGKNKGRWNLACDYVTNLIIKEEERKSNYKLRLPSNIKLHNEYINMSVEQVYNKLPDIDYDNFNQGNEILFDLLQDNYLLTPEEVDRINEVLSYANSVAESKGDMPAGLRREIKDLLYPKVDWRLLLKEFVQSFPSDWDFTNRDRRFIQTPFFLPQFSGEMVKIYVAIDTSGSISPDILSAFMTETYAIISNFDRIDMTLLSVDARLQNIQKVHSLDEALKFELKGGGGTDFRDTFEYLEKSGDCNGLVFFSDMYATFPKAEPHFKTLWISTTDKEAPFGTTIKY